jgi:hypothetical protein
VVLWLVLALMLFAIGGVMSSRPFRTSYSEANRTNLSYSKPNDFCRKTAATKSDLLFQYFNLTSPAQPVNLFSSSIQRIPSRSYFQVIVVLPSIRFVVKCKTFLSSNSLRWLQSCHVGYALVVSHPGSSLFYVKQSDIVGKLHGKKMA